MRHEHERGWLSGHIFFQGKNVGVACDEVLLDVVDPFVHLSRQRGWIRRYFFIRYGEYGPHVRLRLHGSSEILEGTVRPALEAHVAKMLPTRLRGLPKRGTPPTAAVSITPSLLWIPYEPEVARYGGPDGLHVAEQFFFQSSEFSIAMVRQLATRDRAARLGLGLAAMIALLGAFTRDPMEAAAIARAHRDQFVGGGGSAVNGRDAKAVFEEACDRQRHNNSGQVEALWGAAEDGVALPQPLQSYYGAIVALRGALARLLASGRLYQENRAVQSWPEATRLLSSSYMHMTNNRLGLSPLEESYLAHMTGRALSPESPPKGR